MSRAQMTGEVIPFDRESDARQEYSDAIRMWCVDRQLSEALSREEIAALPKFDRVDAQRKALILNLIHYYRTHERADVAPGVAVIIHLLSDNDKGASSVSQATMAKLFDRSASSIGDAVKRLKDSEIVVSSRGRYAATYPVIPRAVTTKSNHLAWLIAAAAEEKPSNLPAPPGNCQITGPSGELKGGADQSTRPSGGLARFNSPDKRFQSTGETGAKFTNKNSTTQDYRASAREEETTTPRRVAGAIAGVLTAALPASLAAAPIEQPAIVQTVSLSDQLLDAGGRALGNPASCPGLILMSEPTRWLEQGCDLEKDILPAIRARSARMPPSSIKSWSYFTQAVTDARNTRLAPLPEASRQPSPARLAPWEEENRRKQSAADEAAARVRAKYQRKE